VRPTGHDAEAGGAWGGSSVSARGEAHREVAKSVLSMGPTGHDAEAVARGAGPVCQRGVKAW
jgi:hypothetical protein